jgi:ribosomal protein S27AE
MAMYKNLELKRLNENRKTKRRSNDKRYIARWKLRAAVRFGKIVKPKSCSQCGKETSVVGHHDDYEKPLIVRWLCRKCHTELHMELFVKTGGMDKWKCYRHRPSNS